MNFDGLLTTIVLSALVLIFGSILRRSANRRLHFWFIAWTLILIHCVVQWLGIPGFSRGANDIVSVDSLICAGTAFLCALCSITRIYYLLLVAVSFAVPSCAYGALVLSGVTSPWLLSALIVTAGGGAVAVNFAAGERGKHLYQVVIVVLLGCSLILHSVFHLEPFWGLVTMLGAIYLFNALLFYNYFPRLSTGVFTSIFGFLTWGAVFPVAFWLQLHFPAFQPPPVLWNLPKFFVAVGMILTLLEDEAASSGSHA